MADSHGMPENGDSYKATLDVTIKSLRFYFILAGTSSFLFASRQTIWIEYASTFNDYSPGTIPIVLFFDNILAGIAGICFAAWGDYIGFDKSITFKLLVITIGCILEAIATNFKLLCIGFLISQTATTYVALAYVAWILPVTHAKKQTSLLYGFVTLCFLLGPIFSGILYKLFSNYRIIFIINASLLLIILIVARIYLYGSQEKIERLQIATSSTIQGFGSSREDASLLVNSDADADGNGNVDVGHEVFPSFIASTDSNNRKHSNFCKDITIYKWCRIVNILITSAIFLAWEVCIMTYYVPFILRKYNKNNIKSHELNLVILSTAQIMTMGVMFVITSIIMSKISDSYLPKLYQYINPNILIIIFAVFIICVCLLFVLNDDIPFYLYWLFISFIGISLGYSYIILDFLLLEIQPPEHAGKITGIKGMIRFIVSGIYLSFVGLYWNVSESSMIYSIVIGSMIIIVLSCILWIVAKIDPQ